jgi:Zn-dependent peptidase ImmA (M78 family)/transcriptional regulator with XRE-family HTH domain
VATQGLAGERVRTLRLLLGLRQSELAELSGVSQGLISQIESGRKPATEELIAAISRTTGAPETFFQVASVDVPVGSLRFRKHARVRAIDSQRVEELAKEAWRVLSGLMEEMSYPRPHLPVAEGSAVDGSTVETFAEEARQALGLSEDKPISHLTRAMERHGIAIVPIVLPSLDDTTGEAIGHFGISCWPSTRDYGLIGYFRGAGDRERFTLAHELGHMVLHSGRGFANDPEGEANRFASAFLLPKERMQESLGGSPVSLAELAQLKARWGTSIQALIMRGSQLGLIDEHRKTSLFKQLSARGWRRNEPVAVNSEDPMLPWKLLERAYGSRPYAAGSEQLGAIAMILRGWAPGPVAEDIA